MNKIRKNCCDWQKILSNGWTHGFNNLNKTLRKIARNLGPIASWSRKSKNDFDNIPLCLGKPD